MPTLPWRFQADLTPDNPDPIVTVFVGDSVTNDVTGVKTIHQDTSNPELVPLSELATYVATGLESGITRTANKSVPQEEDDEPAPAPAPKGKRR